jgi:hypothetical protein
MADPLERLRDADPVPGGGSAPAFASVMARVRADGAPADGDLRRDERCGRHRAGRRDDGRRRHTWARAARPALGVAAALAVVALVVFVAVGHRGGSVSSTPAVQHRATPGSSVPAPISLMPRHGGMPGLVTTAVTFGAGSDLTAAFEQCATCTTHFRSNIDADGEDRWTATSTDSGRTWRVGRHGAPSWQLGQESQSGQNIWANGYQGNTPVIFVSHDDGQTYRVAHTHSTSATAVTPSSDSTLTISDGTVWVFATRCTAGFCHAVVLSGAVGGNQLTVTAAQPALRPHRNFLDAIISAHGRDVYLTGVDDATDLQTFASHDGGRSWVQVTYPCTRPVEGEVQAVSTRSLWAVCLTTSTPDRRTKGGSSVPGRPEEIIRRSSDGGHHWTTSSDLAEEEPTLDAVSDQIAWMTGANGTIERTDDGGQTWQTVLKVSGGDFGAAPVILGPSTATIVFTVTRGTVAAHDRRTDLVAYRTTDGGAHWTATLIRLPKA